MAPANLSRLERLVKMGNPVFHRARPDRRGFPSLPARRVLDEFLTQSAAVRFHSHPAIPSKTHDIH
jgi:hypothetical protein